MELAKFEGDVYVGRIDPATGNFLGYNGPFECDSFEPSRDGGDKTEIKSKRRGQYDQVIYSEQTAATPGLKMVFRDTDSNLLALMFGANITDGTISSGTVSAVAYQAGDLGKMIKLAHGGLTSVLVKDDAAAVTYVLDTDYSLDARLGAIVPLEGGAIAALDPLKISYSYAALSADVFNGETIPSTDVMVYFDGKNRVSGKDFSVEYYKVTIPAPTDLMDLLSSDLVNVTLEGTPITPSGKTFPYRVVKGK